MFDSMLGWGFGAVALLAGLAAAGVVGRVLSLDASPGRNAALDGLRGYLAFGVFAHHAVVWYHYVRTGVWGLPPPGPYRELGATCVSVFFMITAYLFVGKLLDARERPIDWLTLFTSRVLRLTPLYLIAMAVLFVTVGLRSGWQLREPVSALLVQMAQWLGFSIVGMPDVNRLEATGVLIAYVTWSLALECLFYLSLPLLAVLLRVRVPSYWVVACSLLLVLLALNLPKAFLPTAFVKGAAVAFVVRQPRVVALLRRPLFSPLILLAAWVSMFAQAPVAAGVLVPIAFCAVACGNTVYGALSNRAAVVLGDISYGVYLLHGLLLSITFLVIVGVDRAATFSPAMHWSVVTGVGMLVVLVAATSYRFVEWPAMKQLRRTVARLRPPARIVAEESS